MTWILALSRFWRCKEHPCPIIPELGLWRTLEISNWCLASRSWFGYIHWSLVTHEPNIGSLSRFWRCKEYTCPLSPDLGLWRTLEVPDWGLASWYWFGYGHWSLVHPYSEFWLSILTLKVQRTSMFFKSWLGALEDAWSWFGYITGPWYTHVPNFGSLSWLWRCKEHLGPLSPN